MVFPLLSSTIEIVWTINRKKVIYMSDSITDLLELSDDDSKITECSVEGNVKKVTIEKNKRILYCPLCGQKLYSKGRFTRHPNNQIFQGYYVLEVTLIGRRWYCPTPECSYTETDQFSFIQRYKHNTTFNDISIVNELKDIHLTCRQVARRYNVSDTYVRTVFLRYVSLPRLPLPCIMSIDEVYLNISPKFKYALVIMDWLAGDVIDILPSRRKEITEKYFLSLPREERNSVRFLICDMYDPYVNYSNRYFQNAQVITDSFHVLQWLLKLIRQYVNEVKKKYQARDRKRLQEKNYKNNKEFEKQKDSREVYILKNGIWVILQNEKNRRPYEGRKYNHFLNQYMDIYDWEREFLALDKNFHRIKLYKDFYETFNESYANDLQGASEGLDNLISFYKECDIKLFNDFARLLSHYRASIINSFHYITIEETQRHAAMTRRLSNGPMESFNNIPSSFRTQSHGLSDFEFVRNRILWAMRDDAAILAVPKSAAEVHNYTNTTRGSYNKHKNK